MQITRRCALRGVVHSHLQRRMMSTQSRLHERNTTMGLYAAAGVVGVLGMAYASVPLYQMFCQATGYGGTTQKATEEQFKNMKPVEGARPMTVYFVAEKSATMPWTFAPQQKFVKVVPGETALAFYTAHNPTDSPVTGVSTYNVNPPRAGLYFHKIQCFCFEEQRLKPHEEIDMPVFFYIDPAVLDDPALAGMRSLTLSYTFFRTTDPEAEGISSFLGHGSSSAPAAAGVAGEQQRTAATATVASDDTDALRTQIAQWTQKTASSIGSDGSSSPK